MPWRTSSSAKGEAIASGDQATASALVAEAISLLDVDPERSLQLALQSAPMASTPGWRTHCATG